MVRTFLQVYMELGSYFVSARTNRRHHHHLIPANHIVNNLQGSKCVKQTLANYMSCPSLQSFLCLHEQIKDIIIITNCMSCPSHSTCATFLVMLLEDWAPGQQGSGQCTWWRLGVLCRRHRCSVGLMLGRVGNVERFFRTCIFRTLLCFCVYCISYNFWQFLIMAMGLIFISFGRRGRWN
jgi:hypothetical protein